ncbi:glyoxalase [Leifsonia sp. ku-ls]|nr:glyoxalase [Leifsonia sp. ku-ls]
MTATPATPALHRLVLSASSLSDALALYAGVLGLTVERTTDGFAWLRTADGVELMVHERPAVASDAAVAPTFALPALDAAVDRWVAAGGAVVDAPAVQPWGERMAVVRDADGHIVCLVEQP